MPCFKLFDVIWKLNFYFSIDFGMQLQLDAFGRFEWQAFQIEGYGVAGLIAGDVVVGVVTELQMEVSVFS